MALAVVFRASDRFCSSDGGTDNRELEEGAVTSPLQGTSDSAYPPGALFFARSPWRPVMPGDRLSYPGEFFFYFLDFLRRDGRALARTTTPAGSIE